MPVRSRWLLLLWVLVLPACQTSPILNESFPVTVAQSKAAIEQMVTDPRPLDRPVVVIGGFLDPGIVTAAVRYRLLSVSDEAPIIPVAMFGVGSFDSCRLKVIEAVDRAVVSDDPAWTGEVDVVGFSLGGLVARYAASAPLANEAAAPRDVPPARRLCIRRLFTIATPHRGARMAELPTLDRLQIDMRPGSAFLQHLDGERAKAGYQLFAYARLGDAIVGPANAAPAGSHPWWVPNRPADLAHVGAYHDPRIIADIARRLRNEIPLTTEPPSPLPAPE